MRSNFFSRGGSSRPQSPEQPGLPYAEQLSAPERAAIDELRRRIFGELVALIEEEGVDELSSEAAVLDLVDGLIAEARRNVRADVPAAHWQRVRREVLDEIHGLGPLAPLLANPEISDILVNGPHDIWIDRGGRLERTAVRFDDERHLRRLVDRIVGMQGRHLDASSPHVDAMLDDGSRLHVVVPPISTRGTIVSIRRFRARRFEEAELLAQGFCSAQQLELLRLAVESRCNIVIAGGAAAGKTVLLNFLSRYIPPDERVVTVEETAELRLDHPHVVSLETRPPNIEGRGGIGLRELVKTALRMRADRIIIGEVRGEETLDMLQAMNVGHDGSFTTVHASSVGDVLHRLESVALMGGASIPREVVRSMVVSAIDLILYVTRFRDGRRVITAVHEVARANGEKATREIFRFDLRRSNSSGGSFGEHVLVQVPTFARELAARGYAVPEYLLAAPALREVRP